MTRDADNRKRAFADVVTIDAWHESFHGERTKVDLHADVVFGKARVGGETASPVRFRLSVRRAELVVVIPPFEPVSVDRSSVSRDNPDRQLRLTKTMERSARGTAKGALSVSASNKRFSGAVSSDVSAQSDISRNTKLEVSATAQFFVTQSKTPDGNYRWAIEPSTSTILEGRAWDPVKEPRLKLVDERKDRSKGLPPVVRVEVHCRREDLVIEDVRIKDESLWKKLKGRVGFANRLAAAEAYIRDRLRTEGLQVEDIHDEFGKLTLGSVSADSTP